jgi:hypothetical protein
MISLPAKNSPTDFTDEGRGSCHPLVPDPGGGGAVGEARGFFQDEDRAGRLEHGRGGRPLGGRGPNVVAASRHRNWPWRLLSAMRNPLVILLVVLSAISFATKARMRESMARLTPRFCANRMCRSCSFFSTISIPGFSGGAFCR